MLRHILSNLEPLLPEQCEMNSTGLDRVLDLQEESFVRNNAISGQLVIYSGSPFSLSTLQDAMALMHLRHPVLRSSIVLETLENQPEKFYFKWVPLSTLKPNYSQQDYVEISEKIGATSSTTDLLNEAKLTLENVSSSLNTYVAPYLRMVHHYHPQATSSVLAFVFPHILMDGRSRIIFLNDLFRALAHLHSHPSSSNSETFWEPLPPTPALLPRLPIEINPALFPPSPNVIIPSYDDPSTTECCTKLIFRKISSSQMEKLQAQCRKSSVTIGSAFVAAMLWSMFEKSKNESEDPNVSVLCGIPFDTRHIANPPTDPTQIGNFALPSGYELVLPKEDIIKKFPSIWDFAADVKSLMQKQVQTFEGTKKVLNLYALSQWTDPAKAFELPANLRFLPFIISNVGVMKLDVEQHLPYRIEGVYNCAKVNTHSAALWCGVHTVPPEKGQLCGDMNISVSYPSPLFSEKTVVDLLDRALALLNTEGI